jgi:hypothetical protein
MVVACMSSLTTGPDHPPIRQTQVVLARWIHNDRLVDALGLQAFCALTVYPGARASYDRQRIRGIGHRAGLRQLANRLAGILHGCLKTRTIYDETTALAHHTEILKPSP